MTGDTAAGPGAAAGGDGAPAPRTEGRPGPEDLRAQAEHTRYELGRTVEALLGRADPKDLARRQADRASRAVLARPGTAAVGAAALVLAAAAAVLALRHQRKDGGSRR